MSPLLIQTICIQGVCTEDKKIIIELKYLIKYVSIQYYNFVINEEIIYKTFDLFGVIFLTDNILVRRI